MQLKRVSSDEIRRNYMQITGREALERLLAGEEVFGAEFAESRRLVDGVISYRYCESVDNWKPSGIELRAFFDPEDDDWYVAPPFDARKEMLARPGEWVAKYTSLGGVVYIGLDIKKMIAIGSFSIENTTELSLTSFPVLASSIDEAIPLDYADLAKLVAMKADEKGVNANG